MDRLDMPHGALNIARYLKHEYSNYLSNMGYRIEVLPSDISMPVWKVIICPVEGYYKDKDHVFKIYFPISSYYTRGPHVRLLTPIYHPNMVTKKEIDGEPDFQSNDLMPADHSVPTHLFWNNATPEDDIRQKDDTSPQQHKNMWDVLVYITGLLVLPDFEGHCIEILNPDAARDFKAADNLQRRIANAV